MCNRFRSIHAAENSARALRESLRLNYEWNPNVAPTDVVPVFIAQADRRPLAVMARFGVIMTGRDGKPRQPLLNVRTDGIRRGQFRSHMKSGRCIIPALGWYEFRDEGDPKKQPYYFYRTDGEALNLAGIWEESEYKGDRRVAFAILTDEPNALVAPYHDRMPLALADDQIECWLDLSQSVEPDLTLHLALDLFAVRPVDKAVNSPREKDISRIDPGSVTDGGAE